MNNLVACARQIASIISRNLRGGPPFGWQLVPLHAPQCALDSARQADTRSAKEIISELYDGFVWDVQKKRRSIEVRLLRKFGMKRWAPHGYKMLEPKTNIIPCRSCGHFHEAQFLCEHCLRKNQEETKEIQESILNHYGFDPIEHEVSIRYKGESVEAESSKVKIVEMEKERPKWFASNLMSTSNHTLSESKPIEAPAPSKFKEDK